VSPNLVSNLTHHLEANSESVTTNGNQIEANLTELIEDRYNNLTELSVIEIANSFKDDLFNSNLTYYETTTDSLKLVSDSDFITNQKENELTYNLSNWAEKSLTESSSLDTVTDPVTTQFNPWRLLDLFNHRPLAEANFETKEEVDDNFPKPVYIPESKEEEAKEIEDNVMNKTENYHLGYLYHSDLAHQLNKYYRLNLSL